MNVTDDIDRQAIIRDVTDLEVAAAIHQITHREPNHPQRERSEQHLAEARAKVLAHFGIIEEQEAL